MTTNFASNSSQRWAQGQTYNFLKKNREVYPPLKVASSDDFHHKNFRRLGKSAKRFALVGKEVKIATKG